VYSLHSWAKEGATIASISVIEASVIERMKPSRLIVVSELPWVVKRLNTTPMLKEFWSATPGVEFTSGAQVANRMRPRIEIEGFREYIVRHFHP
jgi:hypothetical protein